jgi:alkylation response protein AidB-like acyl-CoA dehydrogenase
MPDVMTRGALVAAAARLAPLAAAGAVRAERQRRLDPDIAEGIVEAGFARHFAPARRGGTEGTFAECLAAVAAVAEGDPSAGWCASLAANFGRLAAFLPEEGQQSVWDDGPDARIAGTLVPAGSAVPAPGGWRVSGAWHAMSGVHHADWAMVCCAVPVDGDRGELRVLVVPRRDFAIADSWHNVGLRATGSDTAVVEGALVPVAHSFPRADLLSGQESSSCARCYRVGFDAVNGLSFAAPVLGAVEAAMRMWSSMAAQKRASPRNAHSISGNSDAAVSFALARCTGEVDAARLLLERGAADADAGMPGTLAASRGRRDYALAVDLLVRAANRAFRHAGTRAQSTRGPFQRHWRDANAAAGHAALQFEPAARAYTDLLLGERSATEPAPGGDAQRYSEA